MAGDVLLITELFRLDITDMVLFLSVKIIGDLKLSIVFCVSNLLLVMYMNLTCCINCVLVTAQFMQCCFAK